MCCSSGQCTVCAAKQSRTFTWISVCVYCWIRYPFIYHHEESLPTEYLHYMSVRQEHMEQWHAECLPTEHLHYVHQPATPMYALYSHWMIMIHICIRDIPFVIRIPDGRRLAKGNVQIEFTLNWWRRTTHRVLITELGKALGGIEQLTRNAISSSGTSYPYRGSLFNSRHSRYAY